MIVGNGVRLAGNPNRFLAAPLAHNIVRSGWNKRGALLNIFTAPGVSKFDGIPSGMRHPQVWVLPMNPGGLASRFDIFGDGEVVASLAGGLNGEATIAGVGEITAADIALLGFLTVALTGTSDTDMTAEALAQALSDIAGTGVFTADITSVLNATADLVGEGALTADAVATLAAEAALSGQAGAVLTLAGAIAAAGTLAGSSALSTATLNAITPAIATLAGQGVLAPPTLAALGLALATIVGTGTAGITAVAKGSMVADISLAATLELSPDVIASTVKAALLDTTLDGFTIEEIIKLTSAALLGKSSGGATNPVFRSIDDTADRVTGEVDASGNRTSSTLSP